MPLFHLAKKFHFFLDSVSFSETAKEKAKFGLICSQQNVVFCPLVRSIFAHACHDVSRKSSRMTLHARVAN